MSQVQVVVGRPVRVRSGEMPGSLVARPPALVERRASKRGNDTPGAGVEEPSGVTDVECSEGQHAPEAWN